MLRKEAKIFSFCFGIIVFLFMQTLFSETDDEKKNGFKITKDTVLNVGLSVTPEYESNITKASEETITTDNITNNSKNAEEVSDLVLHYSPSIRIKLDDQSKTVGMSIFFDYNHYLGLEDKNSAKKLSDLDIKSELLGEFNKNGGTIFDFKNTFSRSATPDGQEISGKHKNILDNFVLGLGFKNIEDTLYGKIQAGVDFNYLEQSKDSPVYKNYNYVSFVGDVFGRWKFLPRTMLFIKGAFRYQDYYESEIRDDSRSMPINVFAGLMGQVSPYFSAKLSAGYSTAIAKNIKHDYNANAEVIFKYNETTFLNVGYLRNMRPSPTFQYYTTHRLYLNFKQKFARDFLAAFDFAYSFISFGNNIEYSDNKYKFNVVSSSYETTEAMANGTLTNSIKMPLKDRNDQLMTLGPSLAYKITSWFGLKLSYDLEYRKTDFYKEVTSVFNNPNDTTKNYDRSVKTHYNFINHRVMLAIVLDY